MLPVLVPPLHEQAAIIEYLDKATTDIDSAIVRARRQIDLVEEYRTRLIADVVTCKLDVREVAAQLPEEPDDQDRIEGDGQLTEGMDKDLYDADASAEQVQRHAPTSLQPRREAACPGPVPVHRWPARRHLRAEEQPDEADGGRRRRAVQARPTPQ